MPSLPLLHSDSPRLVALIPTRLELVLGAFQRPSQLALPAERALVRRLSGGGAVRVGPGSVHLVLTLPRPDALTDARPSTLVNRHVRPLLRALGRLGKPGFYGGRDFVAVERSPVAWVGFAHDGDTGASVFEAFLAVTEPFAGPELLEGRTADPFRGHAPRTLAELGLPADVERVRDVVLATYEDAYEGLTRGAFAADVLREPTARHAPPWDATLEEAVGVLGASAVPPAFGGDLFASTNVVRALEAAAAACPGDELAPLERALADARARTGGTLEGLRDPASLAEVMLAARRNAATSRA